MSVQTQHLRAVIWPLLNPDTGVLYCDRFSWQDIDEIGRVIERARRIKRFALIHIEPDVPMDDFLLLIKALGERFGNERAVLGVDVCCPGNEAERTEEELRAIANAFYRAFPYAIKYVCAGSAFESIMKDNAQMGLIVTQENAHRYAENWLRMPLRMAVDPAKAQDVQFAIDNHVSILEAGDLSCANVATHAGYRFQMNTVQLDEKEVTVLLENVGTLPCYTDAHFQLRLSGTDVDYDRVFPLTLAARDLLPGSQRRITKTLDVSAMPHGEYDVQVGLFCDGTDYPISFGIEGRISDGYYEGRLILCL